MVGCALVVGLPADQGSALGEALAALHFHVFNVRTLADARVAAGGLEFDLLVTALELPDGTGIELLRALVGARPRVAALLADSVSEREQVARLAGFAIIADATIHGSILAAMLHRELVRRTT